MQCHVPDCEEDGIYCQACCDSCYCHIHKSLCTKRICKLCNGSFEGSGKDEYCETCDSIDEASYLKCPFQGCSSRSGAGSHISSEPLTKVECCSTYYCREHIKYQDWRKCCPGCTTKGFRCILCVKTKPCPCGHRKCRWCENFLHENNLDKEGKCNICYHSPYSVMEQE